MHVLVLNCGSATLKFQLIAVDSISKSLSNRKLARGIVDGFGDHARCRFAISPDEKIEKTLRVPDLNAAVNAVFDWLKGVSELPGPDAVGHRVVHGGSRYTEATRIDDRILSEFNALCEIAPLHNPAAISAIHAARERLGDNLPMVAAFDTAFHSKIPAEAATYAIPSELAHKHQIRRYGFHGLAYQSVLARYAERLGAPPEACKIVALHLGNGCSAAAIRDGRSVDTSMGFTPLEGLVMGTRSGDIDPALVSYLASREGVPVVDVETLLNKRSGLLGLSGSSNDMRSLLAARNTDPRARLAVDVFCHRARKYLGAYLAVLQGADAVVFSGGIGENAPLVRERIASGMEWCGIHLESAANRISSDDDRCISATASFPQVWVIHADEEAVIACETARVLGG